MILILCIEENGGILFHDRRLSQDRKVRENILQDIKSAVLWMNAYSSRQFDVADARIRIAEDFMEQAGAHEYCFWEGGNVGQYEHLLSRIVLYKWNRRYPSDTTFDIPLKAHGWQLVEIEEFAGYSHEKITKEVYTK
ncbi:MAG: ribonuclease Z [Lachnospiraceae bacterium]